VPQFLDAALFVEDFGDYIAHVHIKDSRRRLDGRRSILGSHLDFGHPRRGWDFVSAGRGDVDFEALIRALGAIGYRGPLSIEWEDSAMDRENGAQEALRFIRGIDFEPSQLTPMGQLGAEATVD
jgi:sugar phosphate isomerase/epimerase